MHDFVFNNSCLDSSYQHGQHSGSHTESNFAMKVINFAAANKPWRLVCNSGNEQSCKQHCNKFFPGNALAIDECSKAVKEAFDGGIGDTACFPMSSVVTRKTDGIVPLSELRTGDEVLVPSESGLKFDSVVGFLHWTENVKSDYIRLVCGESTLRIHRSHMMPIKRRDESTFATASEVRVGDIVETLWIDGSLTESFVSSSTVVEESGLCCPVTESGLIIVDSVVCSCYAAPNHFKFLPSNMQHSASHALMAPMRLRFTNDRKKPQQGIHPYAKLLMTAASGAVFS